MAKVYTKNGCIYSVISIYKTEREAVSEWACLLVIKCNDVTLGATGMKVKWEREQAST